MDYQQFLRENRAHVNRNLNKAVAACVFAGVGIFIGTALHLWSNITYTSAIVQAVLIIVLSLIMLFANKKLGETYYPSVIGFLSLDLILGYSANVHIGIYLTYFFVPLLAIAYCDTVFYLAMAAMNYVGMFLSVLNVSDYYGSCHLHYYQAADPGMKWFISHMTGYTIEYFCMTIAGWFICKHIAKHMESLYDYQSKSVRQFKVMGSATDVFEKIYYISDSNKTYVATHDGEFDYVSKAQIEAFIRDLEQEVTTADAERFREFVDLTTVEKRLGDKRSIEGTFYSTENGYFEAMFIAVSDAGKANGYIFTTRDINEQKAKERTLNEMARKDQPTGLRNRRAYEEDIAACKDAEKDALVIVVADINGLKVVNDTYGHLAGDELILAAAETLNKYFGDIGIVYRVGGDEFHILAKNMEPNIVAGRITSVKADAEKWKGKTDASLSLSLGYASTKENPTLELKQIQKLADRKMYEDKEKFYDEHPEWERRF